MATFPDPDERLVIEAGCARCPALAESRECISWGVGPQDADVVVVGEAPGAGDPDADQWRGGNWTGMAYTTRHSGRRIRETMAEVGYAERTVYTNAVKCFPSDGAGSNREPTAAERETCRSHLLAEVEAVEPAVVVTTGKHATQSVLSAEGHEVSGFVDSVLKPVDCDSLGVTVVPLLHPSYRDVWLGRLDTSLSAYRGELRDVLDGLVDGAGD
ncbi:uracil-DNA glycosylase family protein [Salinirubrum litoreum]|uniref:Uracil-DNA glycosylase family protein n=1 Tax=Salinirubrum litoreum TaxID=1126234 RepID=A0ABD5R774_9EURY|nr:uracil-DNA glycosylase family protein [Salinirubrum litoreum]